METVYGAYLILKSMFDLGMIDVKRLVQLPALSLLLSVQRFWSNDFCTRELVLVRLEEYMMLDVRRDNVSMTFARMLKNSSRKNNSLYIVSQLLELRLCFIVQWS